MSIFNAIQKLFTKSEATDKSIAELYREEKDVMHLLHSLPEHERKFIVDRIMKNYPGDKNFNKTLFNETTKILKKDKELS